MESVAHHSGSRRYASLTKRVPKTVPKGVVENQISMFFVGSPVQRDPAREGVVAQGAFNVRHVFGVLRHFVVPSPRDRYFNASLLTEARTKEDFRTVFSELLNEDAFWSATDINETEFLDDAKHLQDGFIGRNLLEKGKKFFAATLFTEKARRLIEREPSEPSAPSGENSIYPRPPEGHPHLAFMDAAVHPKVKEAILNALIAFAASHALAALGPAWDDETFETVLDIAVEAQESHASFILGLLHTDGIRMPKNLVPPIGIEPLDLKKLTEEYESYQAHFKSLAAEAAESGLSVYPPS